MYIRSNFSTYKIILLAQHSLAVYFVGVEKFEYENPSGVIDTVEENWSIELNSKLDQDFEFPFKVRRLSYVYIYPLPIVR